MLLGHGDSGQGRPAGTFDRRTFLVASALLVGACGADRERRASEPAPTAESDTPGPGRTPERHDIGVTVNPRGDARVPGAQPWEPSPNEVEPTAKQAAARVIEALGMDTGTSDAAERLRDIGADGSLADEAGALIAPASSASAEIVYPQYGGLSGDRACVMAVTRQVWAEAGETRDRTVTADLRLRRSDEAWSVTELRVPEHRPRQTPEASRARELAGLSGVDVPDAALADLADGIVDDRVIEALIDLANDYAFSVTVFRTGHPEHVFGTGRVSNHTRGRAVDIWAINGRPIVEMPPDDPLVLGFLEAARHLGSNEIGGPVDPDGAGGVHFTDQVHRDHIHLGFH